MSTRHTHVEAETGLPTDARGAHDHAHPLGDRQPVQDLLESSTLRVVANLAGDPFG